MAGIEELLDAKMEAEPDGPAPWDDVKKEEMEAKPKVSLAEKSKPAPRFAFNVADLTPDNFRDVVYQQVSEMIDYFGGPTQYLESKLSGEGAQAAFASDLLAAFPRKPDLRYQEFPLPRDTSVVNTMHLSDLGYGDTFSSKPKPFAHTCKALLDEFVTNGFISASDPLLLVDTPKRADHFWLSYVKGAARSATLLMLAHIVIENNLDLTVLCPYLHESMLAIYCRTELLVCDAESIAFANAKLSARGAIRRAHCVLTWLGVLQRLKDKGLTASEVVKRWNSTATKEGQLAGAKRQCLLQLLGLPDSSMSILLAHLSEFGGGTVFHDDTFSQKRLLPGGTTRGCSKEWQQRLTVSEPGFNLMLRYIDSQHRRKLPGTRCKYGKGALEEALNMCQLLVWSLDALSEQHPVPKQACKDLIEAFLQGDMSLEVELQAALSEKSQSFNFADVGAIKKIAANHIQESQQNLQKLGRNTSIAAGQLERQEFDLMMATLAHDLDVWRVHLTRSKDRQAAIHFQVLQYRQKRLTAAKELAKKFMSEFIELHVFEDSQTNFRQVEEMVKKVAQLEQLPTLENVTCLVILNWGAPCVFPAEHQRIQAALAGGIVNQRSNVGLYIAPSYCRTRGTGHKQEKACQETLAGNNLNLDEPFVLPYKGKNDERERRTLVMCGKILMPASPDDAKSTLTVWRRSPIFSRTLLQEADLVPTKEMLVIEDLSDTAVPASTDATTHINPPEKVQQIGIAAGQSLLRGVLTASGQDEGERKAHLVVDLTTHTADVTRAFVQDSLSKTFAAPTYYIGFTASEGHQEWGDRILSEFLADGFLSGSLPMVTGSTLPPSEIPSDQIAACPPAPGLSTFAINQKVKVDQLPTLKTPDRILQQWFDHQRFGSEFRSFIEKARAELLVDVPPDKGDVDTSANRKRGGPAGGSEPLAKVQKVQRQSGPAPTFEAIKLDSVPTPRFEGQLPKKLGSMVITIGQRIFVCNRTGSDIVIPAHTTVAGFYKGQWWHRKKEQGGDLQKSKGKKQQQEQQQIQEEKDILFDLVDASSTVLFGGTVTNVGKLVSEKQKSTLVKISFHDIQDSPLPSDPAFFKLKRVHDMYFTVGDMQVEQSEKVATIPLHHLAGLIPWSQWQGSFTTLAWTLKWSAAKGFVPVRPLILTKCELKIPTGMAIEITPRDSQASGSGLTHADASEAPAATAET